MRRVVVTGIGLITPLGVGVDETWDGLMEGRSAVGPIEDYDASSLRTRLGAEVRGLVPKDHVPNRRALRTMTRNDVLGTVSAVLAVKDAGLEDIEDSDGRTAVYSGSNKEISDPYDVIDAAIGARDEDGHVDMHRFGEQAQTGVRPLFFLGGLQAASLFYISDAYKLRGPNTYFAGTAETGANAIGRGYRAIARGEADRAVAGGFDNPVSWWNMSRMDTIGIMSRHNELGASACRPYDRDRDGTVMGEGGAFFLLEEMETAKERGARAYAEVVGFGSGIDTGSVITPEASGEGLVIAIEAALREAEIPTDDVDYLASHGSGTLLGDSTEAAALRSVFGDSSGTPASSVKPATGHLCAGAGALNAAVATLAVHRGGMPPTLNLEHPDPHCNGVDWIPNDPREAEVRQSLALARGFEGQNVALAFRAV